MVCHVRRRNAQTNVTVLLCFHCIHFEQRHQENADLNNISSLCLAFMKISLSLPAALGFITTVLLAFFFYFNENNECKEDCYVVDSTNVT